MTTFFKPKKSVKKNVEDIKNAAFNLQELEKKKDENNQVEGTTILLRNINSTSLDRDYSMKELQNYMTKNVVQKPRELKAITNQLVNLGISEKTKEPFDTVIFGNKEVNVYTTFNNKKGPISSFRFNCWYDRNPIPENITPISLPIRFINKNKYCFVMNPSLINVVDCMEENLDKKLIQIKEHDKIILEKSSTPGIGFFEGEGCFCSFNCMMAYLNENHVNVRYRNSGMLTNLLYKQIFGNFPKGRIKEALNWRMLKEFGGEYTIEEFRKNFQHITYHYMNQYLRIMPNGPIQEFFEQDKN